ncbi:MAG: hypothetical protein NXI24_19820 [bacterium]|nr:hypothetical protein [bacterium]
MLLALFFGLMIGTVAGSLLEQIFGLSLLNWPLFGDEPLTLIEDFYFITKFEIQITPGGLLGFAITAYVLYRKGRS